MIVNVNFWLICRPIITKEIDNFGGLIELSFLSFLGNTRLIALIKLLIF